MNSLRLHQGKRGSIGVDEAKHRLSKYRMVQSAGHVCGFEPLRPPCGGSRRHTESRLYDFTDSDHPLCDASPCQGTYHRTRAPHVVAKIEVVTSRVVIADGLLYPLQTQNVGIEICGALHI